MTNQERTEWVKTLQVGDRVVVDDGIETVMKITPKGQIRTSSGKLFKQDGTCSITYSSFHSKWYTMRPATAEEIDRIRKLKKRESLIRGVSHLDYSKVSLEKLEKIWDVYYDRDTPKAFKPIMPKALQGVEFKDGRTSQDMKFGSCSCGQAVYSIWKCCPYCETKLDWSGDEKTV